MPLPETIPVRYSEEEAGYVSLRPVVRQTFGVHELLDMVLRVTGKDAARVRQILRSGTIAYHCHRYWWAAFETGETELAEALARFPDADPTRVFNESECVAVVFESGGVAAREIATIERSAASHRRWLRPRSLWDFLLATVRAAALKYHGYSYECSADVFCHDVGEEEAAKLEVEAERLAPRGLRHALRGLKAARRALFISPRSDKEARHASS
ncbi:MAG TPA: hypothetical protein VEH50_10765 [Methylomirabilota bacterium]|nr:hypothetical protein [Methylomirabilota bacterium]